MQRFRQDNRRLRSIRICIYKLFIIIIIIHINAALLGDAQCYGQFCDRIIIPPPGRELRIEKRWETFNENPIGRASCRCCRNMTDDALPRTTSISR